MSMVASRPFAITMEITVTNQQNAHSIDQDAIRAAVRSVLADSRFTSGSVDVAIVDDRTIHDLNRRFLDHDWPTDVLSFVLEESPAALVGEIIISADTAASQASEYGWSPADELLLYIVHGTLHLVGYDDKLADEAEEMRAAEGRYLERLGVSPVPRRTGSFENPAAALAHPKDGGTKAS